MIRQPFNNPLRRGPLGRSLAAAFALAFLLVSAGIVDVGHLHNAGPSDVSCYTCQITPDLGPTASRLAEPVIDGIAVVRVRPACLPGAQANPASYLPRGPALLS
jgi:hypothetical protein